MTTKLVFVALFSVVLQEHPRMWALCHIQYAYANISRNIQVPCPRQATFLLKDYGGSVLKMTSTMLLAHNFMLQMYIPRDALESG